MDRLADAPDTDKTEGSPMTNNKPLTARRWKPRTGEQKAVYDYYIDGGERGDLVVYFRRGVQGIMKPEPGYDNALAAWMAGRDHSKEGLESVQPPRRPLTPRS